MLYFQNTFNDLAGSPVGVSHYNNEVSHLKGFMWGDGNTVCDDKNISNGFQSTLSEDETENFFTNIYINGYS